MKPQRNRPDDNIYDDEDEESDDDEVESLSPRYVQQQLLKSKVIVSNLVLDQQYLIEKQRIEIERLESKHKDERLSLEVKIKKARANEVMYRAMTIDHEQKSNEPGELHRSKPEVTSSKDTDNEVCISTVSNTGTHKEQHCQGSENLQA